MPLFFARCSIIVSSFTVTKLLSQRFQSVDIKKHFKSKLTKVAVSQLVSYG